MVFVSYSSKNSERALQLVGLIETIGIKCWISDRDLPRDHSSWADELMKMLSCADTVLLVLTHDSAASGEVLNEISRASADGKNIIPLIEEDFDIPDKFKYFISKYEWIPSYRYNDDTELLNILRKRLLENTNLDRERFWKVTTSKEFKFFCDTVMKLYYGESFFTLINGMEYPVYCVEASPLIKKASSLNDFDSICDYDNSDISDFEIGEHQDYVNNKWFSEYNRILEGRIRYPDRPGYMLDEIRTDKEGKFVSLTAHVGTYAENVYSTHVLEYEMYRAFLEFGDKDVHDRETWEKLRNSLTIRNNIHQDVCAREDAGFDAQMASSLLKGKWRDTLLSVQMLVILFSDRKQQYEVKCVQRSNLVAVKPGVYQFIPAGGFEILNDSDDDDYDDIELEENFSPGCAVFREYLEEMFNAPEFEGRGNGSIEDRLLKDPRIMEIENMLREGAAEFHFLGSTLELAGLRHELSFAFIVHDGKYSNTRLIANEECKKGKIISIGISEFEGKHSIWENLHAPSASMWEMFKRSGLYDYLNNK